jgi:hypothetical protein
MTIRWLAVDPYYEVATPAGFTLAIYQPGGRGDWNWDLHFANGDLISYGVSRSREDARRIVESVFEDQRAEAAFQ